jgi:laminin B (domain IV)
MRRLAYLCLFLAPASAMGAGIIASSNWELAALGTDNWSFINDGTNLIRVVTGGNPGSFLQVSDQATGGTVFFAAPAKFLGNASSAYGGSLSFDLQQSFNSNPFPDNDVVLTGNGITLAFDTSPDPAVTPNWSSYNVGLLASAGWKVGNINGVAATEAQMQSVLANLTDMQIRAEFQTGADVDGIDNVVLSQASVSAVPEPATVFLILIGCAGLLLGRLGRR